MVPDRMIIDDSYTDHLITPSHDDHHPVRIVKKEKKIWFLSGIRNKNVKKIFFFSFSFPPFHFFFCIDQFFLFR